MPNSFTASALRGHARGWRIIPLSPGTKRPSEHTWQHSRFGEADLIRIFESAPQHNLGVILGEDGLVDVDLDCEEVRVLAPHFLPRTPAVFGRPGRRRTHWLYRVSEPLRYHKYEDPEIQGEGAMLVEIRSTASQQTMIPPSVDPGGAREWDEEGDPAQVEPEELRRAVGKLAAAALLARNWGAQGRHFVSLHLSGGLLRAGWDLEDVIAFVEAVCLAAGDEEATDRVRTVRDTARRHAEGENVTGWPSLADTLGERSVRKLREWLNAGVGRLDLPLTDSGNAHRLVHYFGQNIRYCPEMGHWFVWDTKRWCQDTQERIIQIASETARKIYEEAAGEAMTEKQQAIGKWAVASQNVNRLIAMVRLARTVPEVQVRADDLDRDPWLLNCHNGTLNLRTGGLQPFTREDMLTRMTGCAYDPRARAPRWERFLDEVMGGNADMVSYLQRATGYTLTGSPVEQKTFMCYGSGSNGKSTFLEVLKAVFGEYARTADFETFLSTPNSRIRTDIARLKGARFVTASEAEEGRRLAPALIKQMTGGERVTARFLFKEEFEFLPVMKLWMATNHRPVVRDSSHGFWRRMSLIPFTVQFREAGTEGEGPVQDRALPTALAAELPGILVWAVRGCRMWQDGGLGETPEIAEATGRYQSDMDVIAEFLLDRTAPDTAGSVRSSELYRAYVQWCRDQSERPLRNVDFKTKMEDKGYAYRVRNGYPTWFGLRLRLDPSTLNSQFDDRPVGDMAPFAGP